MQSHYNALKIPPYASAINSRHTSAELILSMKVIEMFSLSKSIKDSNPTNTERLEYIINNDLHLAL